ncbi:hypothetical protein HPP92_017941 [Vanilla planifolia]|uniref:Uncharacterized protein n=1 Tax=Vanilla planifolia TaxID=51239 RepID=A0A835UNY7_VANPL|nr:hypothetical protein HPP92_017941 [Vanilla planifolia]
MEGTGCGKETCDMNSDGLPTCPYSLLGLGSKSGYDEWGFGMATSRLLGLPFSCQHDDLELIVKARFWRRPLAATLDQMESFGDHLQHCGGLRQAALVEDKLEDYDEGQQGQQPM